MARLKIKKIDSKSWYGAGFLIQNLDNPHLFLALETFDGIYDLPKGEKDRDETPFQTAQRECWEECNVYITPADLIYTEHVHLGKLILFIANTNQKPLIRANKKSGIIEHKNVIWCTPTTLINKCIPYLTNHLQACFLKLGI